MDALDAMPFTGPQGLRNGIVLSQSSESSNNLASWDRHTGGGSFSGSTANARTDRIHDAARKMCEADREQRTDRRPKQAPNWHGQGDPPDRGRVVFLFPGVGGGAGIEDAHAPSSGRGIQDESVAGSQIRRDKRRTMNAGPLIADPLGEPIWEDTVHVVGA